MNRGEGRERGGFALQPLKGFRVMDRHGYSVEQVKEDGEPWLPL